MGKLQQGNQRATGVSKSNDTPQQPVFMERSKAQGLMHQEIGRWSTLLERLK